MYRYLFLLLFLVSCQGANSDKPSSTVLLDIPPRIQWDSGHGYCGETSIQSIGLYYGAWISQQIIRDVGDGEILLGVNSDIALQALNFNFEAWKQDEIDTPQYRTFLPWMKAHLLQKIPVVFGAYLAEGDDSPDYDHIMPAVGIQDDTLIFYNNYDVKHIYRDFKLLHATRSECQDGINNGGCIPDDVDFGVAISGIVDKMHVTKPVRLIVNYQDEPNINEGEFPRQMRALVIVSDLTVGQSYALLRYDDYSNVPTDGLVDDFLYSDYKIRIDFIANDKEWHYTDPVSFRSDSSLYYRVVPID